jgi:thiol-disulfide isomerase/thioredoxin
MKKIILFIIASGFSLVLNAQMVSNFAFKDLENTNRTYNDLKGEKLTLLDFWATWCKPCTKAIPELNKIYQEYGSKGVEIIGINCDGPRSISKVIPMSKSLNIQYPILLDINSDLKMELNIITFPTLVIVNSAGKIIWIHEGYVPGDEQLIRDQIEKLLKSI